MKRLFFIVFALLTLGSCSLNNDDGEVRVGDFYFEYVPITTVEMPTVFQLGETSTVEYTYHRPTTCHSFNDLFYDVTGNTRTIAVINTVVVGGNPCAQLSEELVTRTFNFSVNSSGPYLFRFWQGVNEENGEDIYLEFEVPVNE